MTIAMPPSIADIPTNDAEAALKFCRALADTLQRLDGGASSSAVPDLSIVIPVFNEEENVLTVTAAIESALRDQGLEYEIILVDDGSGASTCAFLEEVLSKNPRVVLIQLSRNFGHQAALSAGLDRSRGKAVLFMDCDGQDPPAAIPQFLGRWREGFEVVYAVRESRKEGMLKRFCYKAFYRILRLLADIEIPVDAGDFCLMDRRVVDVVRRLPERNRFLRGLRTWSGFRQTGIQIQRNARTQGRPKYTLRKLSSLAFAGIFAFSYLPLRLISLAGIGLSIASMGLAVFYFIKRLTQGLQPPGFATTVVLITFLAGVQLITMGVIGEYIGRIFEEVKQRPLFVIRSIRRGQGS